MRSILAVLAIACGLSVLPAEAAVISVLDGDGNVVEVFSPDAGDWVMSGPAGETSVIGHANSNWEIQLATADWGKNENQSQQQRIWGAGLKLPAGTDIGGYRVDFSTTLYTWDSYNNGVLPPTNSSYIGLWDSFNVLLSTSGYYWDVVGTGADPVTTPESAGVTRIQATPALGGIIWSWGGRDYSNGGFEQNIGTYFISLLAETDIYLSFVLDTASEPTTDEAYPSWGSFNPVAVVPPPPGGELEDEPENVPEPGTLLLLGIGLAGTAASASRLRRGRR